MSIYGISVDVSRGFDVLSPRGQVLAHCASYELARALAAEKPGRCVRYWAVKA